MPNWVFNTLDGYSKELHDKYKSDDIDIDFNKIIPEPEEITNTPSGNYNRIAKNICAYKEFIKENKPSDYKNPLADEVKNLANRTTTRMGELAIENPDKSLNVILEDPENSSAKHRYDEYVSIFGNKSYYNSDKDKVYDNYCKFQEESFQKAKEHHKEKDFTTGIESYDSLEHLGKTLINLEEKYGFDNWYDWRNANWGTKWNACHAEYDEESQNLRFDTAWSVPEPILAKIAEDNPNANIDVYSEEETGWFNEYTIKDQKLYLNATGEITWDEDSDQTTEQRTIIDPPEKHTFEEIRDVRVKEWTNIMRGCGTF